MCIWIKPKSFLYHNYGFAIFKDEKDIKKSSQISMLLKNYPMME